MKKQNKTIGIIQIYAVVQKLWEFEASNFWVFCGVIWIPKSVAATDPIRQTQLRLLNERHFEIITYTKFLAQWNAPNNTSK